VLGLPTVLRRVQAYHHQVGTCGRPAVLLTRLAAAGRRFHDSSITPPTQ
jgi:hypothetical protein